MQGGKLKLSRAGLIVAAAACCCNAGAWAGDGDSDLQEIIVTAEKLGRSLMNTPASTVVLDHRELESRAGLITTRDLLETIPNVVLSGTGNTAPVIRGVDGTGASQGADAFFAGSRPRLNVQVDGRPLSYNEIVFGDSTIWDVQQVEVLRGAQSTLQGRNAIAGTVVTKTSDPTFDYNAALRVGGGDFGQKRASAMISGPVDDAVAFRVAADWLRRQSFVKGWQGFPSVDNPGDFKALTVRGKLLFEPKSIDGWKTLLTVNHSDYSGPQTENVSRPFADHRTDFLFEPVFEPKTTSVILDSRYALSPKLDVEGVLSGTDLNVKRKAVAGQGIVNIDGREYLFEPRLRYGGGDERTSAVAGLYLFRAQQDESIDFPSPQTFDDRITTLAVFSEGIVPLAASLDLIVGARYEEETHERHGGDHVSVAVNLDETYKAFLPKLGLAWHLTDKTTVGGLISRGYNGGGGGFTFDSNSNLFTNYQYGPEYVWTYEIYGRQALAQDRLQLTANLFYSDYKNMQLSYDLTPADPTDYSFIVKNAPKAESYGAEFGATAAVARGLRVYANLGWLHAKITRYPGSGFQGNELPFAPCITGSAGFTFNRDAWEASLTARYSDSYYSDIENNPRGDVDPYWIANAQLGYTVDRVRFFGRVDNVFDSHKAVAIYSGATVAEDGANILKPRSYWLGVEWRL